MRARMEEERHTRSEAGEAWPVLVWRLPLPVLAVSSTPFGGGFGLRHWVLNAQVPAGYDRRDPAGHVAEIADGLALGGQGVGMLTAAEVGGVCTDAEDGVEVAATVGARDAAWAAAPPGAGASVGTINVVVLFPERLSDGALVNALATVTEAKAQALWDAGIEGTGTPTDAVCVLCPPGGRSHAYGGPRSTWGSRGARAVHRAISAGLA